MLRIAIIAAVAGLVFAAGQPAHAAAPASPMVLSKPPLFLNAAVDPNLLVTFDDSGSMSDGSTPDSVRSIACEWRHRGYYSAAFNKQYFDPAVVYTAPLKADGTSYPNSTFASAPRDGYVATSAVFNLGTAFFGTSDETASDVTYAAARTYADCTSGTNVASNRFTFPTGSAKAFYCTHNGTGSLTDNNAYSCTTGGIPSAEQQNFANWFSFYRFRGIALKSAVSRAFGALDDDVRVALQNLNSNGITATTDIGRFQGARRTNFFNSLVASPYTGNTPTLSATMRAGAFFERAGGNVETNPYWDATMGRELTCRQNFHVLVSDGYWNQFSGTGYGHPPTSTPGNVSFKSNRILPDGKAYSVSDPNSRYIWNEAARGSNCDAPGGTCSPSYADLAFHYWYRDLRTNLTDNVPAYMPERSGATAEANYWNPENDPATWQHMVQFFIGFGISGKVPNTPASLTALRNGTAWGPGSGENKWPSALNLSPESVDDSWHAALASRGALFAASDPNAVVEALTDILASIVRRKGSASAVAVATSIVRIGALAYQTQFDSTDWSGTVIGRTVNADLTFGPVAAGSTPSSWVWDAGCMLTGGDCATTPSITESIVAPHWDTGRKIITSNAASGTGTGVGFRWANLSDAQRTALDKDGGTAATVDSQGSNRLNYLRGDRSKERSKPSGIFRNRTSIFGAVVHSGSLVLDPPSPNAYDDTLWPEGSPELMAAAAGSGYAKFAADTSTRATTVFVGANDGMLHALDGSTGSELWAYVPYAVYTNLRKLTSPAYQFEPYVDNSVTLRDVYINGGWRSLLVGSLARGGQGVYALDVTSRDVTEDNASSKVLWEFNDTSAGGADLGYTYGIPFITRLNNGKWVVLLPGGYNSEEADGTVGSGKAVLFVLDAADGSVLRKFDLSTSGGGSIGDAAARGLAAPIAIDLQQDDISEIAYAGDLNGNLWRFDLTANSSDTWSYSKLFAPTAPFDRPITAQPRAERSPDSRLTMLFVGTGKYLEVDDRGTSTPTQAFYAITDTGTAAGEDDLGTRSVTTSAGLRTVGSLAAAASGSPRGWKIVFDEAAYPGERVVSPASLRIVGRRVIFTTLITSGSDPCLPGGRSFLMFADLESGGAAAGGSAFFDVNGDETINASDSASVSGKLIATFVPGVASVLPPGGGIGGIVLPPIDGIGEPTTIKTREFEWRRRSWRELFRHN